ncbi:MAG TPA: DNA polymerase III subunit alpha, partial [Polyangiaceae bacterium]
MFAELLARSCFSFLRGASHPEEMVDCAKELALDALALCDRDGLYGSVRAYTRAREIGQRILVGSELTLSTQESAQKGHKHGSGEAPSLALLVQDHTGYENLCRLLTLSHAEQPKGESALELDWLERHRQGLMAVIPAPRVPGDSSTPGPELFESVREVFSKRSFIAVYRHLDGFDRQRIEAAKSWSRHYGLPILASARPMFHHLSRKPLMDVMFCIRTGKTLDRAGTDLGANAEAALRSELEMRRLFREHPSWVDRAGEVGQDLGFGLAELRYRFPCELEPGQSAEEQLRELTFEGLGQRYPGGAPESVVAQVEKELQLIQKLGVAPYFLCSWQIVQMARRRSILCQGRGSAANSAVCYALGITAVDPARSNLLFERFLSAERQEPPDIDIDFEHERREEVIQEIYQRYGRDHAGMVSEVICYRGKSALREVGKVFGLSLEQVDRLSGTLSHWSSIELDERGSLTGKMHRRLSEMGFDAESDRLRKVVTLAHALRGFPRHLSIHVGGFVLSATPLYQVAPVEPARMQDRTVVPWDKDDLEELGFFKVDVLGLGMLTAIRKCLVMMHETSERHELSGQNTQPNPLELITRIPAEDPSVYQMICGADTVGVFQIESRAQMAMLPRLRPQQFYDLVVEVAIVRPGPIQGGMVHPYLRRRNGEEPISSPHPDLCPILKRTLGVPLFQEQVMQIAITGAGYSGGEADQLRRDMAAWKKTGKLLRHRQRLLDGFTRKGISKEFSHALFEQIKGFGDYGFPECVIGDTLVLNAATGRRVRIQDVVQGREKLGTTIACDQQLRLRKRRVLAATPSGAREVFRLHSALGRTIVATPEHPLLTLSGWRPLASLRPNQHVAVARQLPSIGRKRWRRHEIIALADVIAEGSLCHPQTFYFYTSSTLHRDEYVRMIEQFPNTLATVTKHRNRFSIHVRRADRRRPCGALVWAEKLELIGKTAANKQLPAAVFELKNSYLALLLARLWESAGHLSLARCASYDTASCGLAEEVQHLLLRLGIVSRVYQRTRRYRERNVTGYTVTVTGKENLSRFSRWIAHRFLDPKKKRKAERLVRGEGRTSRDFPLEVHVVWDRVLSVERVGIRKTYDLTIQGNPNFLANDFIVHNSHAASFALLVYASAWQKAHYPAHFAAALLNSQPMGFYSPSSIIQDAQRHGVEVREVSVVKSDWDSTLEEPSHSTAVGSGKPGAQRALRLGLRLIKGFGEAAGRAIESARAQRAFTDLEDLRRRAQLKKDEVEALAASGALEELIRGRRHALWKARAPRLDGLFNQHSLLEPEVKLPALRPSEQLLLDYEHKGLSVKDHPMRYLRSELNRRRALTAAELLQAEKGRIVSVAGLVICRQQPGTASG